MSKSHWEFRTVSQIDGALKALDGVAKIYEDASHWTQGTFARDEDGKPISVWNACSFCLVGALNRYGKAGDPIYLGRSALEDANKVESVIDWNDAEGRTIDEVRQFVRNGIEFLENVKAKKLAAPSLKKPFVSHG